MLLLANVTNVMSTSAAHSRAYHDAISVCSIDCGRTLMHFKGFITGIASLGWLTRKTTPKYLMRIHCRWEKEGEEEEWQPVAICRN